MPFVAGVYCDKCNTQLAFSHTTKTVMTMVCKEKGWKISRKDNKDICLCPKCKEAN